MKETTQKKIKDINKLRRVISLFCVFTHVDSIYANVLAQKKAFT